MKKSNKTSKILLNKTYFQKICVLTGRLQDPIESDPVVKKNNSIYILNIYTVETDRTHP